MPKSKKKTEPIKGIGRNQAELLVQKSRPLFSLWRSNYTLADFKILDAYLSRINSQKPDDRTVVLEKGELEKLLGVTKISKQDLDARLSRLGSAVDLAKNNPNKSHHVALFEEAYAEKDDFGIWTVRLTCTPKAMQYFFNVEELGYLRYKLRSITSLTSRYTYLMFIYLEANRFRKTWDVDLNELKEILGCDDDLYSEYKRFNERILKRCHTELIKKTECRYTYEPVRKGRAVGAIRFTLETRADLPATFSEDDSAEQLTIDTVFENVYEDETLEFLAEACKKEFNEAEMMVISDALVRAVPFSANVHGGVKLERYECLMRAYHNLEVRARREDLEPIKNRLSYLVKMIEREIDE